MYLLGVLAVATGIGISIALHEIGHLVPAKLFGVKVTQYMVGFGPTLWSGTRGETEYGVKAIPLGGYVRMIGMYPPLSPERASRSSSGRWATLMEDARAQSMDEIGPGDEERVFYKLSTPKKIIVMLGGPLMNLLIATLLLGGLLTLYGVLDPSKPEGAKVTSVTASAPAATAGIQADDTIVSIDGTPVTTPTDISRAVRPNSGRSLTVVVLRDEQPVTVRVTPIVGELPSYDAQGQPLLDANGKAVTEKAGFIGTTTRTIYGLTRQPITQVPAYLWNAVSQTAEVVVHIPEKMVGVVQAVVGNGQRDPNGPTSVVGVGRAAGEKAGGEATGSIIDDIAAVPFIIQLLAGLNIALFVFNLIPLMPLDGGQVAGALWEGLKRTFAKVTGRPDPGYVDVAKTLPVTYVVASALIVMSVILMYADIVKPVRF